MKSRLCSKRKKKSLSAILEGVTPVSALKGSKSLKNEPLFVFHEAANRATKLKEEEAEVYFQLTFCKF